MELLALSKKTAPDRSQLQQIIAGLTEGVILLEPDQTITYANEAALDMHGVTRLEELGLTVDDYRRNFVLHRHVDHAGGHGHHPIDRGFQSAASRASLRYCHEFLRSQQRGVAPHAAIGQSISFPVGFYVEFRKTRGRAELPASHQPFGEFDMIADIEELDRVAVIFGKFEKRMRARGHDPATEFKGLRDRPR